jgi:hypothetical protein
MSSNEKQSSISMKARIEHIVSIIIPSLFIVINILTFEISKSFYCDYFVFIYTTLLLLLVVLKLIKLNILNRILKDYFSLIDGIKGKGIILICISLLYILNGGLRTLMSIFLLINGLYLLLIEWLWPSKDNLLSNISKQQNQQNEKNVNVVSNAEANVNGDVSTNTVELDKSEDQKPNNNSNNNPYDIGEDF